MGWYFYVYTYTYTANSSVVRAKNTDVPGWVIRCHEVSPSEAMFLPIIIFNLLIAKPTPLMNCPDVAHHGVRGMGQGPLRHQPQVMVGNGENQFSVLLHSE